MLRTEFSATTSDFSFPLFGFPSVVFFLITKCVNRKDPLIMNGVMERLTKSFRHSFPLILYPDYSGRLELRSVERWEETPKLASLLIYWPTCFRAIYDKCLNKSQMWACPVLGWPKIAVSEVGTWMLVCSWDLAWCALHTCSAPRTRQCEYMWAGVTRWWTCEEAHTPYYSTQ